MQASVPSQLCCADGPVLHAVQKHPPSQDCIWLMSFMEKKKAKKMKKLADAIKKKLKAKHQRMADVAFRSHLATLPETAPVPQAHDHGTRGAITGRLGKETQDVQHLSCSDSDRHSDLGLTHARADTSSSRLPWAEM